MNSNATTNPHPATPGETLHELEPTHDFVEYWRSITKRKWAILAFGASVAMLAAAIVFVLTPIYKSTTTLLIDANKSKVVSIDSVYSGFSDNHDFFQTQVEILKSNEIALRTINKLKLWEVPEFDPRKKDDGALASTLRSLGIGNKGAHGAGQAAWTDEALARAVLPQFTRQAQVEPVRLSLLVKVSFESSDKELAARVANMMANMYIDSDLDVRFQMTQKASSWLQERMGSIREKLDASERALQTYRDQAGILDVKSSSQSGAGKQIEEVTQRVVEARLRRAEAENAYNQIKQAAPGADLSSLPAVVRNAVVGEALKQKAEAERKLSEVAQRYGQEHPKYVQAEGEAKSARENVKRQIDTVVASVTREYEVARGTERTLEGVLGQARGSVQSLNRKEFQLGVLEREVESNKQIYDMFVKRSKETNLSADLEAAVARVVDTARVVDAPVKPQKTQWVVLAFALGLIGGIGTSMLLDLLDNTLKTTADVEARLKQPLLASIPLLAKRDADRSSISFLFRDDPKSLYAESIRTARTGVLLSSIDLPNRILVVTSSVAGEGKTTFSINLAVAHSRTKKTLLIDADLRRPAVAKGLEMDAHAPGLSNLVLGAPRASDCIRSVPGTALSVMTAGVSPPNPLELLLSQRFKDTLDALAREYEIIVIDSPPVELVSDALVLSKYATGVIYVVKAVSTPYQLARRGLLRIRRADGPILGVVLNQLDFKKAEKYYGEYSGYAYEGYGETDGRGKKTKS
ncbi:MAG: polysaccharide biosynthesis tyrosine autokinase [Pseudomonadota bacterium]